MLKVKQVREKEKKNNLSLINERWVNVDGLMHLIRANLVCVCVFLIFFFFWKFKENTKLSYLAPTLQKTFHFLGFLYSWFFVIFYRIPFWNVCFGHFVSWKFSKKTQFIYASLHDKYLAVMLLTIYQSSPPWEIVFYPLLFRKFQFHPSHCYGEFFLF